MIKGRETIVSIHISYIFYMHAWVDELGIFVPCPGYFIWFTKAKKLCALHSNLESNKQTRTSNDIRDSLSPCLYITAWEWELSTHWTRFFFSFSLILIRSHTGPTTFRSLNRRKMCTMSKLMRSKWLRTLQKWLAGKKNSKRMTGMTVAEKNEGTFFVCPNRW